MYFNILKKDLKRKKTMNTIILLFIALSTMFVSSSVNNITAVFGGIAGYFEKADMPDYFIVAANGGNSENTESILNSIEEIDSYGIEPCIMLSRENLDIDKGQDPVIFPFSEAQLNYFDENNDIIDNVKKGTMFVSIKSLKRINHKIGDKVELKIGDYREIFEIAGFFKDALYGADMSGSTRVILSNEDYDIIKKEEKAKQLSGNIFYVRTDDAESVSNKLNGINSVFSQPLAAVKLTYLMDMLVAGILLAVSVLLIITAFIVLRFTIGFTLSEEFREIGVMKAIGIRNYRIRLIYITKYFFLAVIGAAIGFLAGIPFGNMMLDSGTKMIVLENDSSIFINVVCSIAVIIVIMIFCFGCTGKVVRLSPVDAVRNGQTGERFAGKGAIQLGSSRLNTCLFLSVNDILSSPKRYAVITAITVLCLLPVLIVGNTVNTLKGRETVKAVSITVGDVYIKELLKSAEYASADGSERFRQELDSIENKLNANGIPSEISCDVFYKLNISHSGKSFPVRTMQGINTKTDEYEYSEGTAPINRNEIALSAVVAENIAAHIGDTVKIKYNDTEEKFIVTAIFQTLSNLGESIRINQDIDISFEQFLDCMPLVIKFKDSPNNKEISERVERIKNILDTEKVFTVDEIGGEITGVTEPLEAVRMLILILACIISALAAILTERSFIENERSEIIVLKAMGFRSNSIIAHHVLRMGIVTVISGIVASLFSIPSTKLVMNPIFGLMGVSFGMEYTIKPAEIFLEYPAIILGIVITAVFLSALYTRSIKTSEISGIE